MKYAIKTVSNLVMSDNTIFTEVDLIKIRLHGMECWVDIVFSSLGDPLMMKTLKQYVGPSVVCALPCS